ncbi:twin-arginine translocase TatA/TatE family subunit [Ornithinimicrobium faecis]|uniref:Sec-independent protein translocase protein TatA n=1 Tax=Ornithinimicrobium faecis TaxID=2934158 RepID=A0ABY4Z085_9MICO|nr:MULTISPECIES: twin-arginine translocase TatA/TatE family subunit [unclassified Ornithinimicrobium]USQ82174.1 twin-arginine translocase TatA/TatE family subunit [Ornithinimicrobium sp. HY1793]
MPSGWQLLVIVVLLLLLFGWKSLPNMARSLGQSMRIFKSEVDQMKEPSAASQDTVKGEPADRDRSDRDRTDRDRAGSSLGDRARDTAEGVKDKGTSVRDEFRDGLHGDDHGAGHGADHVGDAARADETHRDEPRA